jgi:GntR family transcriptional regulator / MocR family aminotransferase
MVRPLLKLDRNAHVPLYRQLESQLREGILVGRFRPGLPLPGVRSLARDLGIGRITVSAAYEELAADGYLHRRVGVGTRVAESLPAPFLSRSGPVAVGGHRHTPKAVRSNPARPVDFRHGHMDVGLMPTAIWERLLRDAWRGLARDPEPVASSVHDSEGDARLREAITTYFSATRGIRCVPEQVVIVSSAQAACAIAVRVALSPGGVCVIEDPSTPQLRQPLDLHGATVVPVPADEEGLSTDALPPSGEMALVTPAWQHPGGGRLSPARRAALLDWATSNRALIVEADMYGHVRYDHDDIQALQADDSVGSVIYVATFSTMLYPGVRTAFAVVPPSYLPAYRQILEATQRGPAAVEQAALARFVDGGHLGRHVLRLRQAYSERQATLIACLDRHVGGLIKTSASPAGTALIGRLLDDRIAAAQLANAAAAYGVHVDPLSRFRSVATEDREIVLAYAHLTPIEIEAGVRRLAIAFERSIAA